MSIDAGKGCDVAGGYGGSVWRGTLLASRISWAWIYEIMIEHDMYRSLGSMTSNRHLHSLLNIVAVCLH